MTYHRVVHSKSCSVFSVTLDRTSSDITWIQNTCALDDSTCRCRTVAATVPNRSVHVLVNLVRSMPPFHILLQHLCNRAVQSTGRTDGNTLS